MDLYVILRRNGWPMATSWKRPPGARPRWETTRARASAGSAATCSRRRPAALGTVCIYEAESPEAIRAHAQAADLPADEIIPVADTVIVRPDPE